MESVCVEHRNTLFAVDNDLSGGFVLEELDEHDCMQVSGGHYGTGPAGIFSATNLAVASRFAGGIGLLYGSWQVGWGIGTSIYEAYSLYHYQ